jgi:hypothetical protein
VWHPPLISWTKCNSNEAIHGNPENAECGGVFRDYEANFKVVMLPILLFTLLLLDIALKMMLLHQAGEPW